MGWDRDFRQPEPAGAAANQESERAEQQSVEREIVEPQVAEPRFVEQQFVEEEQELVEPRSEETRSEEPRSEESRSEEAPRLSFPDREKETAIFAAPGTLEAETIEESSKIRSEAEFRQGARKRREEFPVSLVRGRGTKSGTNARISTGIARAR